MSIRAGSTILPLERDELCGALARSVGRVSSRICVLVHGLMSTESIWRFADDVSTTYGTLLADAHGVTPLTLRYNTGRHVLRQRSRTGPAARPTRASVAGTGGRDQPHRSQHGRTRHPLGLPLRTYRTAERPASADRKTMDHQGSTNRAARRPQHRGTARGAHQHRPARHCGRCPSPPLDWSASDSTVAVPASRTSDSATSSTRTGSNTTPTRASGHSPIECIDSDVHDHLVVAGTVTTDPEHPLARIIGDALVTASSASGLVDDAARELFPGASTRLLPKTTHNALAHDHDVFAAINAWWRSSN